MDHSFKRLIGLGRPITLYVDADVILYRFAHACCRRVFWDKENDCENYSDFADIDEAKQRAYEFVRDLLMTFSVLSATLCFTTGRNFRYSVLDTYKHNRADREVPEGFEETKAAVMSAIKDMLGEDQCWYSDGLEADDLLGIAITRPDTDHTPVLCTIDKDLDQIPGWHFNWNKGTLYEVTLPEAEWFFHRQVLTGDPTDGYYGCPGMGPKRAEKLLGQVPESEDELSDRLPAWWGSIVDAYASKGLPADHALKQARVARILRHGEWDERHNSPILWTPPVIMGHV